MSIDLGSLNWLAIAVAAAAAFMFGGLWYGPIAGKQWMAANGHTSEDEAKMKARMGPTLGQFFVMDLVMAIGVALLAHNMILTDVKGALILAFVLWITIAIPFGYCRARANLLERAYMVDAPYDLLVLIIVSLIVVLWQ